MFRCRWKEGRIHEWSVVSYPDKLPEYVEAEFKKIKTKQASLLGIKNGSASHASPLSKL